MTEDSKPVPADDPAPGQIDLPLSMPSATPAAVALHRNFLGAVAALKSDLLRSVHYLRAIHERRVHRALGYDTITAYAAAVAGFSASQTEAFLVLGRRLEKYPETKQALADGSLSWSKARLIVSRADPEDERAWLAMARGMALGRMRKEVGGREPEARPPVRPDPPPAAPKAPAADPPTPSPPPVNRKLIISYALTPEQYARWERLAAGPGGGTKEERLLAGLEALGDDLDGGGPGCLLVIHECPRCLAAELPTSRGRFPVDRPLLLAARCDAVKQAADGTRRATIPPRLRRRVLARDGHACRAPGCAHTRHLEVHHRLPAAQGGSAELENLVTLCGRCHRELHRREEELREAGRDPCGA